MDYLRVLLVPFQMSSLLLVGTFTVLMSVFDVAGFYGVIGSLFLQIWVLKYCYVIIETLADGAVEPPVMSTDILSPFEIRPWVQLALVVAGTWLCISLGGVRGQVLAVVLLLLLPASIAILGFGEPFYQAVNPLTLYRVVRGLGPFYGLILGSLLVYAGLLALLDYLGAWKIITHAADLLCEISFFSFIGGCLYLRRKQLGFEPSRSPERAAARAETERIKLRQKMLDDVFQQVRIGKHVDATRPLAAWFRDLDGTYAARDALYIAEQIVRWDMPQGLNTIASTLIRHLLRSGRADAALGVFEILRARASTLTLDSAPDLRLLIEYAESVGRSELAASMRLETPIYRPQP